MIYSLCFLQAFSRLKQSMHRQLLFAYNSSAIFINDTNAITYHVTEAWDSMQNTVRVHNNTL